MANSQVKHFTGEWFKEIFVLCDFELESVTPKIIIQSLKRYIKNYPNNRPTIQIVINSLERSKMIIESNKHLYASDFPEKVIKIVNDWFYNWFGNFKDVDNIMDSDFVDMLELELN